MIFGKLKLCISIISDRLNFNYLFIWHKALYQQKVSIRLSDYHMSEIYYVQKYVNLDTCSKLKKKIEKMLRQVLAYMDLKVHQQSLEN